MNDDIQALENEAIRLSLADPTTKASEEVLREALKHVRTLQSVSYADVLREIIRLHTPHVIGSTKDIKK